MIIKKCDYCGDTIPDMERINPENSTKKERDWYMMDKKDKDMCISCYIELKRINKEKIAKMESIKYEK